MLKHYFFHRAYLRDEGDCRFQGGDKVPCLRQASVGVHEVGQQRLRQKQVEWRRVYLFCLVCEVVTKEGGIRRARELTHLIPHQLTENENNVGLFRICIVVLFFLGLKLNLDRQIQENSPFERHTTKKSSIC